MRESDRAGHLRRKYGITEEQYEELLLQQDSKCGVCGKHESEFPVRLAVDHNHRTGEVRGLLCNYCNHRLVGRHTDPELLLIRITISKERDRMVCPQKEKKAGSQGCQKASKGKNISW
jgi:hypothetical protein